MSNLPPLRTPYRPADAGADPRKGPKSDAFQMVDGDPELTAEQRWAVDFMLKRNRARHGEATAEPEPAPMGELAARVIAAGKARRGEA